jgi:23S rRNA (guanosine2251-2'-O)-methyltransferase
MNEHSKKSSQPEKPYQANRAAQPNKRPNKPKPKKGPGPERRVIVGMQPVREAIRAHASALHEVFVANGDNPRLDALLRFAKDNGVATQRVARARLDKLSGGVRHQGVLAFAPELQLTELAELEVGSGTLIVALDSITDPQNFGAVIRSAVAMGASAVLWAEHHAAPLSAATFRASAGAVEHARLCRVTSLRSAVTELAERGALVVALDSSSQESLESIDLTGPTVVVVGAEDVGVSRGVRNSCSHRARLSMERTIDSLNASVAAAIALYEVRRQRQ